MEIKKLNLGCGKDYRKGWVNVDFDRKVKADIYFNLNKKFKFENGEFDYILAQDILEHFTKEQGVSFLIECWRVLKVGGKIKIRTHNVSQIFRKFKSDFQVLALFLYGDTSKTGKLGSHKYAYDENSLRELLLTSGFHDLKIEKSTTNIICSAKKIKREKIKMKFLFSGLDAGSVGGAEKVLLDLSRAFRKKNYDVEYVTVKNSDFQKYVLDEGYKCYEVPVRPDILGYSKGLLKYIITFPFVLCSTVKVLSDFRKGGGNVFLTSGFNDKILFSPIAHLMGIVVVWIEYAQLNILFKRNFYIPKLLYRMVKSFADLVIVPSEYTKKSLIKDARVSESKLHIIPCGIELLPKNRLASIKKKSKILKEKMGLAKRYVVGMVSRIEGGKGQDTLIEALPFLRKRIKNVMVLIVGPGDVRYLKELSRKMKVEKHVKFIGFQEDIYKIMGMFDVFVFPTRWKLEAFGVVTVEAMMMGVPLVASNFGPVPEVVGGAAICVKPTPSGVVNGVTQIYKDKDLSQTYVKKGFIRIRNFDIKKVSNRYLVLIEKLRLISEVSNYERY